MFKKWIARSVVEVYWVSETRHKHDGVGGQVVTHALRVEAEELCASGIERLRVGGDHEMVRCSTLLPESAFT